MSILSLLDNLTEFLGMEITNIIFFAIGRVLGDKIYDLYPKGESPDLNSANEFLLDFMKNYRLVKDIAIFTTIPSDNSVELICRVTNSAYTTNQRGSFLLYVIRGILHQFYSRIAGKPAEDEHEFRGRGSSHLLENKIAVMRGIDRRNLGAIYDDLMLRARFLKKLVNLGVYDYLKVWKLVKQAYNIGVKKLLALIEEGEKPWESD